jgi:predicted CoA-substrate-specific enzyme activase
VTDYRIVETGIDPLDKIKTIVEGCSYDRITATGYGRHLARENFDHPVITEIKAYALGAYFLFPGCRTVIDIGGQDSKVIKIIDGKVEDFEMNDRCAAGTGKFLEVMAHTLGYTIEDFGNEALQAQKPVSINAMCTVFAESEVVSLLARGEKPENIALGIHQSIVNRLQALIGRVGFLDEIVFAGGVAKNRCIISLLEKNLARKLLVPDEPQIVGAIGAAIAADMNNNKYA